MKGSWHCGPAPGSLQPVGRWGFAAPCDGCAAHRTRAKHDGERTPLRGLVKVWEHSEDGEAWPGLQG